MNGITKTIKKTIYGLANHTKGATTTFEFKGRNYDAADLGNIHFGAVGKAYGLFSEKQMLEKAGEAQISAGTSKPEWQKTEDVLVPDRFDGLKVEKRAIPPYGDDPRDQEMIKEGFKYADQSQAQQKK